MMTSLIQRGRNERGTASIELAFSLMIFLFVAFGIVEYGSIINERNALTQLAREGASLASRNLTTNQNMMDLLGSTDNALDFKNYPSKYHIYLAQITAGTVANNNPTCTVVEQGGLNGSGVAAPALPNCDLPQNLYDYLVYVPGTGATVQQFTVLKVYYEHDPITPLGALATQFGWGAGSVGNSVTLFSQAIF
ncbi:TadE/TadG family type IV pilus assembly protein [Candidatus Nitrospira allomarina]|jgi:TadE-like protein|uniref:TadE/TadG family type IV pilus assembly protein n=1 Tax=Candidatus Nitrospira allomarina TaxID=3020900 RepID=A0AA96JTP0_9BACT|nr:TadE/TadG family type IV pilus assembly protein [Candidatus Nitrospira allomarina]WNM59802.1 TadE/TadG family type IV pilus assembly protein [Candidatus Nitrospira allomarina]